MKKSRHHKNNLKKAILRIFTFILGVASCLALLYFSSGVTNLFLSLKTQSNEPSINYEDSVHKLEIAVVNIANIERVKEGLAELSWDKNLYGISKEHSWQMANRGEMFHSDETEPYAENVIEGYITTLNTPEEFVKAWMNSPLHRTWIMCPGLKHIAVGIVDEGNHRYGSWTFWRSETNYEDWWYSF